MPELIFRQFIMEKILYVEFESFDKLVPIGILTKRRATSVVWGSRVMQKEKRTTRIKEEFSEFNTNVKKKYQLMV